MYPSRTPMRSLLFEPTSEDPFMESDAPSQPPTRAWLCQHYRLDGTTIKTPAFAATRNCQATGAIKVQIGRAMRAQVAPCGKWQAATSCSSSRASSAGGSRLASRAPFVAAPARGRRLPAAAAGPHVGKPDAGPWFFTETGQKTW